MEWNEWGAVFLLSSLSASESLLERMVRPLQEGGVRYRHSKMFIVCSLRADTVIVSDE